MFRIPAHLQRNLHSGGGISVYPAQAYFSLRQSFVSGKPDWMVMGANSLNLFQFLVGGSC